MKVLVVSDSHGDRDILVELIKKYKEKVDAMIHCGDSELAETDSVWQDMMTVKGNTDFEQAYPTVRTAEIDQEQIIWVHGHLHDVKKSKQTLLLAAKEAQAKFAFFGHTHELGVEILDGILMLNPGSILSPRGAYRVKTYAIVETVKNTIQVTYYNRLHQPIEELNYSFTRS
ncbi:metallophosphoesterase [Carnobacterium funditum]|uniref:metallophosphoesterase n=1 Tax=Carnobacterium funditum TaxID=2752 RepID=UPI000553D35F|nr:metallophosphoesterase [Carnobacterium funditum]